MPPKDKKDKKKDLGIPLQPVHGTRDMYPEEMRFRTFLFDNFRVAARSFGFEEYDAPILEHTALWRRKQGEEIVKQLFNFTYLDDGVEQEVCLRPEMTPSLTRLVLQRGKALLLPIKWFAIAQCWRLETVQLGRKREHFQWNADIFGVKSTAAEAELLGAMISLLSRLGLTSDHVRIRLSDRRVLAAAAAAAAVPADDFGRVCVEIDKLDKVGRDAVIGALKADPLNLSEETAADLLRVAAAKSVVEAAAIIREMATATATATAAEAPAAGAAADAAAAEAAAEVAKVATFDPAAVEAQIAAFETDLGELVDLLGGYGYADWIHFDATIVRGLAYYTGTVFEAFDKLGPGGSSKFRAIAGGGRYNDLTKTFGAKGEPIPACGFGFGDCVIEEVLRAARLLPAAAPKCAALVIPFDASMRPAAMGVLRRLRDAGLTADLVMDKKEVKWSFSYADRRGALTAVFVAPDEVAVGNVRVKMLREESAAAGDMKDKGLEVAIDEVAAVVRAAEEKYAQAASPAASSAAPAGAAAAQ